jgi:hypothetical protein
MEFLDIRYSDKCPNCGHNLFDFIWNKDNVLSVSGRFENFDNFGFSYYRNICYQCPNCNCKFYVTASAKDSIFQELKEE